MDGETRLKAACARLRLNDEVKWQKISTTYADKYIALMDELFDIVAEGDIKLSTSMPGTSPKSIRNAMCCCSASTWCSARCSSA